MKNVIFYNNNNEGLDWIKAENTDEAWDIVRPGGRRFEGGCSSAVVEHVHAVYFDGDARYFDNRSKAVNFASGKDAKVIDL